MTTDEELNRRIELAERGGGTVDGRVLSRVDSLESAARDVHNELARRIEAVDGTTTEQGETLEAALDRLAAIERRLDALEAAVDDVDGSPDED